MRGKGVKNDEVVQMWCNHICVTMSASTCAVASTNEDVSIQRQPHAVGTLAFGIELSVTSSISQMMSMNECSSAWNGITHQYASQLPSSLSV